MRIVAIIPSRYNSTRFEGKPLALIDGRPMIHHVYERVHGAESISDVFVATDDERILAAVRDFGGKAILTSPENRSGTDRAADAAEKIGLSMDDIVVNVQGDQPLIDSRCLDILTSPFFSTPELKMSTLAFRILNPREITDPKDVKVVFDNDGFALYFSRSPIPCSRDNDTDFSTYKHLGAYAYTRAFLETYRNLPEGRLEKIEKLEQLRVLEFGHRIKVMITEYDSPEVDLPEDIQRVERILSL
jgi:3-deoxy-manno-octulosonate cytidylyltransferase (CMP-KDO synthetase)